MYRIILLAGALSVASLSAGAQSIDTLRKNTIKLDLTSYWLYRNAVVFSYERVVKPHQTLAFHVGIQQFPSLRTIDGIEVTRNASASGVKLGIDYRFYLKKENKFAAPHGVYLGPYATYHSFNNNREILVDNDGTPESGSLDTSIDVLNIGVQLGYQFVLNDRWAIDVSFFGPSVSNYRIDMALDGNFSRAPEDIENDILKALIDRFPGFSDLITDSEISSSGKVDTWSFGYRFQVLVGYRFGKKHK